jgi:hypothetical protein
MPSNAQGDREAFHASIEACAQETGVAKPVRGVRPSVEDRAKIKHFHCWFRFIFYSRCNWLMGGLGSPSFLCKKLRNV